MRVLASSAERKLDHVGLTHYHRQLPSQLRNQGTLNLKFGW
jgi:hypothetical protein